MDSESTLVRSTKIRIYPKNKVKIKQYAGLSRYWYNQAVEHLRQPDTKASLFEVRRIQCNEHPAWAMDCPQRIREHAIADACNAVKNAKIKFKKTGQFQQVKYRSKKDVVQGFGFDRISLKQSFVFKGNRSILFSSTEKIIAEKEGTCIKYENGKWYVIIPQSRNIKVPENQRLGVVALDPGVRTFMSLYSPEMYGKIGEGDFNRIYRLCLHLDKIYSKMSHSKCEQKKRLHRAAERLRCKIHDLVDDLHKKTAHFLVTTFDVILIPTFKTQNMVSKLSSKTARNMLTFAHHKFKSFLYSKAEEYSCKVIEVNEAYTSKTCSYCGKLHSIGSRKTMKCSCGAIVDRDLNGARGIFLRAMGASPLTEMLCIC